MAYHSVPQRLLYEDCYGDPRHPKDYAPDGDYDPWDDYSQPKQSFRCFYFQP